MLLHFFFHPAAPIAILSQRRATPEMCRVLFLCYPRRLFFFLRSPRTALPEPFAARSSPGRGPRAPPRTAPLGAATRAQPAPGAPAPPAPSLLRLERAARGCGQLRRRRAGHSRGSAPCSDGSGGQRPPRGLPEPPCCEGAEGPGRAAGGPAGDGVRREK